jgi:hypothetical protein
MDDTAKQHLLQRADDLMGRDVIARRLNVRSEVIETWMRGDATLPDGKLLVLACVLESFSRQERGMGEW